MAKYLWYSGATDTTGMALAEALGITGTKTRPRNLSAGDLLIGWGTKIDDAINIADGITVWNHPNAIRENRNKLASLQKMIGNNDLKAHIAKFCPVNNVGRALERNELKLPLVGRTNYHQGGKGFWLCLTNGHVELARADGAQYFQEFIDIADEYRLHVMFDEVVYAVRKTANPEESSWIANQREKIEESARKHEWELEDETVDRVLSVMVKQVQLPDYIIRSNKRGWKFSSVRVNTLNENLRLAALRTVSTVGLEFGAVDCALDSKGNAYIIEVNSGPGLQGTAKDKYVEIFTAKVRELDEAQRRRERPAPRRAAQAVARVARRAVGAAPREEVAPVEQINDDEAVRLLGLAETDEDRRNVIRLLRRR